MLPLATDADHSDPDKSYTMVYTLRDGDAPVADDDEDKPEYADGDAAAFISTAVPTGSVASGPTSPTTKRACTG